MRVEETVVVLCVESGGKERSAETGQEGLEDVPDYQDSLRQYALGLAEQESTSTSSSPAPKDEENSAEGDHSEETSKKKRKVPGHPSNLQPFPMHPPPPHMMPNGYPMPPYHMPPYHPGNHHLPPEGRRNGAGYPPDAYYSPSAHAAPYRVPGYPPPPPPGMSKQGKQVSFTGSRPLNLPGQFIVRATHFRSEIGQSHSEIPMQSSQNARFGCSK